MTSTAIACPEEPEPWSVLGSISQDGWTSTWTPLTPAEQIRAVRLSWTTR